MLKFDRSNTKVLSTEAVEALQAVAVKHGLTVQAAGGTIGAVKLVLKFEFNVTDKDAANEAERKEFEAYCTMFGLTPEHYKARFSRSMAQFELIGFMPRRPKYPLRARNVADGTVRLFSRSILAELSETETETAVRDLVLKNLLHMG